ncbi:hypothetical protein BpHYR1_051417 [Brachionus plicatilis]|uniref:Uncharacterized protein n=1 Tax=Brachionus plicatilis TaxID=10195 RepID=A0A3M7S2K9_BRAPC|nr:hypothetical protein BpHYR1_051417 [Brachionus plicatilis]
MKDLRFKRKNEHIYLGLIFYVYSIRRLGHSDQIEIFCLQRDLAVCIINIHKYASYVQRLYIKARAGCPRAGLNGQTSWIRFLARISSSRYFL